MTVKNFNIKNGLSVGGVEVINSSGDLVAGGVGAAVQEAIADKIGGIIQGSGSTTVTYDDENDTITISSTGKTEEEIQDIIGAALATNGSHTGLSVSYDDAGDGAVDITVDYSAIAADLIPDGNETRDLGSSSKRWRDLYLSGSTINLGGTELSKDTDGNVEVSASGTLKSLKVAEIEIGTGSDVLVLKRDSNGKLQSRSKNTSTKAETATDIDLSNNDTDDLGEGSTNLYYTDARVKSYLGGGTFDGNIIPSADNTYDLGSSSKMWKDVYIGPGSLYVNGQKVLEDSSGTIVVSADSDQNLQMKTAGSGDIEFNPSGTGIIQAKGTLQMLDGETITNSAGNDVEFGNNISVNQIASRSADTNLVLSGNGTGNVTLNDSVVVTGDLTVSGTTTTVNSETINLADNILNLNSDFTSGSPTQDAGLSISRGGSAAKTFLWDETNDKWSVGSETMVASVFEGNLTGNVTGTVSDISNHDTGDLTEGSNLYYTDARVDSHLSGGTGVTYSSGAISIGQAVSTSSNVEFTQITTNYANNSGGVARNIYQSTSAPSSGDGAVGDLWILYS